MGRALRERANVKIKMPLRAIHVRSSDERALALLRRPFASDLVLDELNIKAFGSLGADDGKLCTLRAKANFRVLGKKVGALMKPAAAAIEALDAARVAELRAGRPLNLAVSGQAIELTPEDVEIKVETTAEFDVETDGRLVVFLDTRLDDELIVEGLARDVVTRVNGLRKNAGLAIDERVRLRLDAGGDPLLARAIEAFGDRIRGETLAVECSHSNASFPGGATEAADLGDGRKLTIHLVRA
jgi:isoleucyl-tRNA synthetase